MGRNKKKGGLQDENLKPFSMSMPEEIHKKFKLKAIESGMSMRDLLIAIISDYVDDHAIDHAIDH